MLTTSCNKPYRLKVSVCDFVIAKKTCKCLIMVLHLSAGAAAACVQLTRVRITVCFMPTHSEVQAEKILCHPNQLPCTSPHPLWQLFIPSVSRRVVAPSFQEFSQSQPITILQLSATSLPMHSPPPSSSLTCQSRYTPTHTFPYSLLTHPFPRSSFISLLSYTN